MRNSLSFVWENYGAVFEKVWGDSYQVLWSISVDKGGKNGRVPCSIKSRLYVKKDAGGKQFCIHGVLDKNDKRVARWFSRPAWHEAVLIIADPIVLGEEPRQARKNDFFKIFDRLSTRLVWRKMLRLTFDDLLCLPWPLLSPLFTRLGNTGERFSR